MEDMTEETEAIELLPRHEALLREVADVGTAYIPETSRSASADLLVLTGHLARRGYLKYVVTPAGEAYLAAHPAV